LGAGWHRQLQHWDQVVKKFHIEKTRYREFDYLCYLDLDDADVINYVHFHTGTNEPYFKHRLRRHIDFWQQLNTPEWLLEYIRDGVKIPFSTAPPRLMLRNNVTVLQEDKVPAIRSILSEYIQYGFIEEVDYIPYCVLPLQLKESPDKMAIIYDMSKLNDYVHKRKFKLESWPEMVTYAATAQFAIKFDLKKFYHQIDIHTDFQQYFGFRYELIPGKKSYFVWKTMPYGYTRAPFIARQLMKPLIAHWRKLGAYVVVFYDDGMAVAQDSVYLSQLSKQMQCDLLRAGLVPGANKCIWDPVRVLEWNGLKFDFLRRGYEIKGSRIENLQSSLLSLEENWPKVSFRTVAKCVGKINSLYPVFGDTVQLRTRMLQTFTNIRHYSDLGWDEPIRAEYAPLYFSAYDEIIYWKTTIVSKNFKPFLEQKPEWLCWSDASDRAIGACVVKFTEIPECLPVTIDNLLPQWDSCFDRLHRSAALHADVYPWSVIDKIPVRDRLDVQVEDTVGMFICHRNLAPDEKETSSTERELLAIVHLLQALCPKMSGSRVTIHTDSTSAAIICSKGSKKPRLQGYAKLVADITDCYNIVLQVVWIPRDLNRIADLISHEIDYADYELKPEQFLMVCNQFQLNPTVDCFANAVNAKCKIYFSATYTRGCSGVDAFAYDWSIYGLCWVFPAPTMIGRVLLHAENCTAHILLLVPQWRNSYFYPILLQYQKLKFFKRKMVFDGANAFTANLDHNSYFGPNFKGHYEVYEFQF
jgi:Reverse transcriptase (RNA-dependent DNA polymerase)/RNase H-like domain found in reverse transcriptase